MPATYSRAFCCALVLSVSGLMACRGDRQPPPATQGQPLATAIGWQVGAGADGVATSAQLATLPGGQEDRFVPAIPTAVNTWVARCHTKMTGPAASLDLTVTVSPTGKLSTVPAGADRTPLGQCLIGEISQHVLPGVSLPAELRLALRISLSKRA